MRIFYSVFVCMIFLFTASQANFNKTLVWLKVETLLMKSIDGNVTFSDLKDCLSLAGSLLMDHNCTLAAQARRLAAAEASGSRSEYASAMFESFYGSKEEESLRRQRRGTNGKTGALTLMSAVWEFVQLEYFLAYYRRRQRRLKAKGRHRRFVPAATGLLKDIDIEVASHISVGNGGGDGAEGGDGGGGGDGEPVPEQPLYEAYIADLAWFFPIADTYIPFDGTFTFFQSDYNLYDMLWFGHKPGGEEEEEEEGEEEEEPLPFFPDV